MTQDPYKVQLIKAEDANAVMDLLRRTFFKDEPMNQSVGLCDDSGCKELEEFCMDALYSGISFKAVDEKDNVVGAILNAVTKMKRDDKNNAMLMALKCPNPKFQKVLFVLAKSENDTKLLEKFPNEKQLVDIKVVATDRNWRKRGIMNALLKETENVTAKRGFRILRMNTSGAYSAKSAETQGFTCLHSAAYADIKMNGKPILLPKPPHLESRMYIKIMNLRNNESI